MSKKTDFHKNNRIEYLILQEPLQYNASLGNVINDYDDIPASDIIKVATALVKNGDLRLLQYDEEEETLKTLNLVESEIENILNQENYDFLYKLTPKGGVKWESFTRPNWDIYLPNISFHDHNDIAKIELMNAKKHVLETSLAIGLLRNEWHRPGSEAWECLEPWNPIYWKTLPKGYRVTVESMYFCPVDSEMSYVERINSYFWESLEESSKSSRYGKIIRSSWYNEPNFD